MLLWMLCGYMALAVTFYSTLMLTATDVSSLPLSARRRWHRTRKAESFTLLRRLRAGLGLGRPKHTH